MDNDRHIRDEPVPVDLKEMLNETQLLALKRIEEFGWELHFIRVPLFEDIVPVVVNHQGEKFGVLEVDGRINTIHELLVKK
jgi:hypothetical protein